MGEQDQEPQYPTSLPLAPFPAPPPFWKSFTSANLSRLEALRAAHTSKNLQNPSTDASQSDLRLTLPATLLPLLPPPPPSSSSQQSYTTFSQPNSVDPLRPTSFSPTTAQTTKNLKPLLHTLTDTLLLLTLQLTTVLSADPAAFHDSTTAIEKTLDLIRESLDRYRPAQARGDVVRMLERRIEEMKGEIRRVERWEGKVGVWLGEVEGGIARVGEGEKGTGKVDGDDNGGGLTTRRGDNATVNYEGQGGSRQAKIAADKRMWEAIWEVGGVKDIDMG